jgi:squalene synthase HpnC
MKESLTETSFKYCEEIAKQHYENFPVASLLLPKAKRKYIYAIYAFARAADDFADEPLIEGGNEKRIALIDEWNQKLKDCFDGKAYDPIFIALSKTAEDCKIPIETLENLLKAFKQDVTKNRYESFDEVLNYCSNSANPVGRLVLMVFGANDGELFGYSDKICTALQLTNFWQDIAVDIKKDRVYLPKEDMDRFEYNYDELFLLQFNDKFKRLIEFELIRTEAIFQEGRKLLDLVAKHETAKVLRKELLLTWMGGMEILSKIRQINFDVLNKRPKISLNDKIKIFLKSRVKKF